MCTRTSIIYMYTSTSDVLLSCPFDIQEHFHGWRICVSFPVFHYLYVFLKDFFFVSRIFRTFVPDYSMQFIGGWADIPVVHADGEEAHAERKSRKTAEADGWVTSNLT